MIDLDALYLEASSSRGLECPVQSPECGGRASHWDNPYRASLPSLFGRRALLNEGAHCSRLRSDVLCKTPPIVEAITTASDPRLPKRNSGLLESRTFGSPNSAMAAPAACCARATRTAAISMRLWGPCAPPSTAARRLSSRFNRGCHSLIISSIRLSCAAFDGFTEDPANGSSNWRLWPPVSESHR